MPESTSFMYSHKELAEVLVKAQGIHTGIWGITIKFGLGGIHAASAPNEFHPAALIPVLSVGIRTFDEENNMTVDASKVNPSPETESVAS
jgi:hypothetical protein